MVMHNLIRQGKSIIFITHKLREVFAVADRISAMRAGQMMGSVKPSEAPPELLAEMTVGRKVILQIEKDQSAPGKSVLEVKDLVVEDDRRHQVVSGVSLEVRAGEILGVAGVQGNGQTELTEVLTGLRKSISGKVTILGEDVTACSPCERKKSRTAPGRGNPARRTDGGWRGVGRRHVALAAAGIRSRLDMNHPQAGASIG